MTSPYHGDKQYKHSQLNIRHLITLLMVHLCLEIACMDSLLFVSLRVSVDFFLNISPRCNQTFPKIDPIQILPYILTFSCVDYNFKYSYVALGSNISLIQAEVFCFLRSS